VSPVADESRIEELRRRVRKDPASLAFAQLAEELRRVHRFLEAVAVCRAGLEIYPGYLSARVTLGRCFIDLNRLDDAKTELEKVREVAPENLVAIRALAEIRDRRAAAGVRQWAENAGLTPPSSVDSPTGSERAVEGPESTYDGATFEVWTKVGAMYQGAAPEVRRRAVEGPDDTYERVRPDATCDGVESDTTYDGATSETPLKPDAMSESETAHAVRTLAALQAWLDAIHVTRASRSA
jgi:tetratricopeptide (TPR) repeat protein